jgi:hypothetical protein
MYDIVMWEERRIAFRFGSRSISTYGDEFTMQLS